MRKPLALAIWSRTIPAAVLVIAAFLAPAGVHAQGGGGQGGRSPIPIVRDAETESFIRSMLDPLLATAGVDRRLVELTLVNNRSLNAFVTQGNRLFLHTGLIQQADSASELAGVLAHEVGHIAGGHLARLPEEMRLALLRSVAAMLLGAGAGVAAGSSDAAIGIMMGGQSSAMGQLYAFTRNQEQAADEAGMVFLQRLGWSGEGLERLLRRLLDQELLSVGRQDPYFRTHPLSRDRLDFVREQRARGRATGTSLPPAVGLRFAMVRAKLNGFIDAPAASWRRYLNDDSAPARYARSVAQYRSGRTDAALEILEPVLREQPANPYLLEFKGQILFDGSRPREAIAPLAAAVRLAPNEPLIRLAYGRALLEGGGGTESLRRAVAELDAAARQDRDNAFVWGQLAAAHARLDDLPNAELALAEQAMAKGDTAEARFRGARAERGLPPGPARQRAADLRNAARRDNLTRDERQAEDELRRRNRTR